jgi:endonuclease/exonuclease/phosphatase family metal-dependent hydrolase
MERAAGLLRLVTINFWGTEAPLDRRLALAERQLAALAPDVVAMQEVRPLDGRVGRTTADVLGDALDMERVYGVTLRWLDGAFFPGHPGGEEGLAILSRHPIREHRITALPEARPTEARILLSARLETAAGPIWCHTTHLHYRLDDGVAREHQVVAIDEVIRGIAAETDDAGARRWDGPQLLCGDFNAGPEHDEIRFLRGLTTLSGRRTHYQDAWLRRNPGARADEGVTWSSENEQTRPLRSLDIDRRIDYVFVTSRRKDGRGTVHDARVVLDEREQGICASDHYGVLADVQIGA